MIGARRWIALSAIAATLATACGGGGSDDELRVFAAASLTDVMADLIEGFRATDAGGEADVKLVLGGSSALVTQIIEGAPADVIITANTETMQRLRQELDVEATTEVATNTLVIAVEPGNPLAIGGLADLTRSDVLVSVCAPEVPCGALTRALFEEAGVIVKPATFEPHVRAVRTRVATGEVDAGLIYRTDVTAADLEAVVPEGSARFVNVYSGAVLGDELLADAFLAFVGSPVGRQIILDAGFGAPR